MELTTQQRNAIETNAPRVCVDAGAGSGKTFVLVQRMVHLLQQRKAGLDEIVAITFTEKAAAEMKARLRREFRARAREHRDRDEMNFWRGLEQRLDGARISTIHAFCMRLLKENALALGIDPDFGLLTEAESRMQSEQAVRETLHGLLEEEDEAVLLLAREYRVSRIIEMLRELLPHGYALEPDTAPFDYSTPQTLRAGWEAAAEAAVVAALRNPEMRARLARHRGALRMLEGACSDAGDKRELVRQGLATVLDALEAEPLTIAVVREQADTLHAMNLRGGSKKAWSPPEAMEDVKDIFNDIKAIFLSLFPKDLTEEGDERAAEFTCALVSVFRRAWAAWQDHKLQRRAMSFDDLIHRTALALRDEAVCQATARGIRYLLMDEFQDTDGVQLAIAQALNNAQGGPDLFIVGDPKQSIYRFRGADVSVFRKEKDRAESVLPLNQNFRTVRPILSFVNDFFRRSQLLLAVEPEFEGLEAYRDAAQSPNIEFLIVPAPDEDDKMKVKEARQGEADLIAARIAELCGEGGPEIVFDEHTKAFRRTRPGDIALLMRAMSNIHLYEEALRRAGIEYGLTAGSGFYERQEVLDVLNLLKVTLDPWDEPALFASLRSPVCGLSDDAIYAVAREVKLSRAYEQGFVPAGLPVNEPLEPAWALLRKLHAARHLPPGEFMELLLSATNYEAILHALPMGLQRASNVRKLADVAGTLSASMSLRGFTRYLDELRSRAIREGDASMQPSESGAVTIMTVHKSKGLEFPVVFLGDCGAKVQGDHDKVGFHPAFGPVIGGVDEAGENTKSTVGELIKGRNKEESLAEHARLLYVGATRARDYLVLCGAPEPAPVSWLASLDGEFSVTGRSDGEALAGTAWEAVVRRAATGVPSTANRTKRGEVDWEACLARVQRRVRVAETTGGASVSALLNALGDGPPETWDELRHDDDAAAPDSDALARGTLVHAWFEQWDFRDVPPEAGPLLAAARFPDTKAESLTAALERIAAWLQSTPLHARLVAADTLLREHPFVWRLDDALIAGTIDLLLNGRVIVDYKTGRKLEGGHQRYATQLQWYAAAVRALTGVAPDEAWLVYADEQELVPVDVSEAAVARAVEQAREALGRLSVPA
ncbi:MAG: AAA family ATPase [Candidatus Hydrogenedens sp.]|nr:AAA family ATPase [Candidatus Hydrogenedens sp.]